jgi:hypothetical protein
MLAPLVEIIVGWGISAVFGGGTLFVILLVFSAFFPRIFAFFWYLFMFPLFVAAFAFGGWLLLPIIGIGSWTSDFYITMLWPAIAPAVWACSPSGLGPG